MRRYYIGNAFSAGMLEDSCVVVFQILNVEQAKNWLANKEWESCIGHTDTAVLVSSLLSTKVEMRRSSTVLKMGDEFLVAQYNGPRLAEGATSLPEGAQIRWILALIDM